MTALIAVLNKNAVALAADSAVSSTKIHNSANKLFTLSKFEPIAVMVYGAAEFMGIPWETIIKMYRSHLGQRRFKHLREYAEDFLAYIRTAELIVPASKKSAVLESIFLGSMHEIRGKILEAVEHRVTTDPAGLEEAQVPQVVQEVVKELVDAFLRYPLLDALSEDEEKRLLVEQSPRIKELAQQVFEELPIDDLLNEITRICTYRLTRDFWSAHSGLVFAGFGSDDVLPVVRAFKVECVFSDHLRYRFEEEVSADLNLGAGTHILPYAQYDVVHRFVKGIDGTYRQQYSAHLRTLLCETYPDKILSAAGITDEQELRNAKAELIALGRNAVQEFNSAWESFEHNSFVQPVINVIGELPIQELASIAESLVSLTSLQRKISNASETVGGPVDVAVISKGDGFVWIKRKHYFEKDLNPGFLGNYFRTEGTE